MAKTKPPSFRFKNSDTIGAAGAEQDADFLDKCFVDTGNLELLRDFNDSRMIVLGRTGTGKSALLATLERSYPKQTIRIAPEELAVTYVTNSTILNFFAALGVNLYPFFKLLWRHVLTVEILTRHFPDSGERPRMSLIERLREICVGPTKHHQDMRKAVKYLEDWGKSFWQDTEYRVKEITSILEQRLTAEIEATLGLKGAGVGVSAATEDSFSESQRIELIKRGQEIISKAQVEDLHKLLKLLDSVLIDKQKGYYLIVDDLDENWVEDRLRYRLIMSLIHTARDFFKVKNAKVILALRRDLIERVFRLTRDAGFQEEKYQSLYIPMVWPEAQIINVLDSRINHLITRKYTTANVNHRDVLPEKVRRVPIDKFIYSIAPRPRDVIAFFNTCISSAAGGQSRLAAKNVLLAEGEYSRGRLRALADEWSTDYPTLADFVKILNRRSKSFKLRTILDSEAASLCLDIASEHPDKLGQLQSAMQVVDCTMSAKEFKFTLMKVFYHVGLIGLKLSGYASESWADEQGMGVSPAEISDDTSAVVHSAYCRVLGIVE